MRRSVRPLPTPPPHDPRLLLQRRSPKANSFQKEAALDDLKDQVRTNADSQYPGPPTPTAIVNDPATETFVLNGYSLKSFTIGITSGNVTTPLTTTPPVWDPVLNKFKTTVNMPATSGTVTITIKYNYGP